MSEIKKEKYPYSWEETIDLLRKDPEHRDLIYNAYLTDNLIDNCQRFTISVEFSETLQLIKNYHPKAIDILDIPGGNGIATYALASAGFNVTTVEPDSSYSVGRGAIKTVLNANGLHAKIIEAYGEDLPFEDETFDVVYVRQGLHHADDLNSMLKEYFRVLRQGGILIACREHVIDNYKKSLQTFLNNQVDHQLYGGEHAFTLQDYLTSMTRAGFKKVDKLLPYDSPINLYPNTQESLKQKIRGSLAGKILGVILPKPIVEKIGLWHLKRAKLPGRLYSFIAKKI